MNLVTFLWGSSAFLIVQCLGFPGKIPPSEMKTAPSYVLEGGYYRNPMFGSKYYPGSLSTVVTQDVIATNSFGGESQYPLFQDDGSKELYTERNPAAQDNIPNKSPELSIDEDSKIESNVSGNRNINTSKRKGRKPVQNENDEDETPWTFAARGPSYTSFFPINISGGGSGGVPHRSRNNKDDQDDFPYTSSGSATAIANAFSTGRGGVATSRATSFGDPFLTAMFLRNGMNNVKGYREY